MPRTNRFGKAIILSSHSLSEGKLTGSGGSLGGRSCKTLTKRVMSGPDGERTNGSFFVRSTIAFAGTIMISHLNGNFLAIALRRVDSLTDLRTTKVPTAPILTMSNFDNCFAI